MAFVPLEKLIHLQDGYRKVFRVNGDELLLLVEGGKTFLISNHCPHMGKPLQSGFVDTYNLVLQCPHHGLEFDLVSGKNVDRTANSTNNSC